MLLSSRKMHSVLGALRAQGIEREAQCMGRVAVSVRAAADAKYLHRKDDAILPPRPIKRNPRGPGWGGLGWARRAGLAVA